MSVLFCYSAHGKTLFALKRRLLFIEKEPFVRSHSQDSNKGNKSQRFILENWSDLGIT